jgi:trehalose/maltose hydrolase-like predicted phosphorylase
MGELLRTTGLHRQFRMGDTVHIATLGGIWQALVLGFGGMTVADGKPRFTPHVPASWGRLRFRVHWRQAVLEVTATDTTATVTAIPIDIDGT